MNEPTPIQDGGYAFPCAGTEGVNPESVGMTLRDYFAAKALQGLIASPLRGENLKDIDSEEIPTIEAGIAYRFADAMLAARQPR